MQDDQAVLPCGSIIQERYVIESVLSKGKSSTVYLVRDLQKQTLFVLKEVAYAKKEEQYRLEDEPIEGIEHPALPSIYHVSNDERQHRVYILMEYIEGPNLEVLRQAQPEQRFSLPQVRALIAPIMDAVIYLHNQHPPIIHQNIKPSNIIDSNSRISTVLVGFSLKIEHDPEKTITIAPHSASSYRALEQYGGTITSRTDVYALGATLYTLLTGTIPTNPFSRLKKLANKNADPLVPVNQLAPTIPTPIAEVIHRALSIDNDDRFSTVAQFWEALRQLFDTLNEGLEPTVHIATTIMKESAGVEANLSKRKIVEAVVAVEEAPVLATPTHPSALSEEVKAPVAAPPRESTQADSVKKRSMAFLTLFAVIVTLFTSLGVGATLWSYIARQHQAVSAIPTSKLQAGQTSSLPTQRITPTTAPDLSANPTVTSTPTPIPSSSPNLAASYIGTLHDISTGTTINISLTRIQQQQGRISGYLDTISPNSPFNGVSHSSPLMGAINNAKHIQFVLTSNARQAQISFEGNIQSDGTMAGTYCASGGTAQKCSNYGLWSVSPGS